MNTARHVLITPATKLSALIWSVAPSEKAARLKNIISWPTAQQILVDHSDCSPLSLLELAEIAKCREGMLLEDGRLLFAECK